MVSSTCPSGNSVPTPSTSNEKISNANPERSNSRLNMENGTEVAKLPPLSPADFKIYNQMADVMERFVSPISNIF